MYGSIVDIQSPTAEIRRGKKKKKPQGKNIMSASAMQGGHNKEHMWLLQTALQYKEILYKKL